MLAYRLCLVFGLFGLRVMLPRGCLAVDMFFVLSGFVLARSHVAALARDRSLRAFAMTRGVRLWPPYAVVTIAAQAWRHAAPARPALS